MQFLVLPDERAEFLRNAFIEKFVDASTPQYEKNIATSNSPYTYDTVGYSGCLWEYMKEFDGKPLECDAATATSFLKGKCLVYVMWDWRCKFKTFDLSYFSTDYPTDTMIIADGDDMAKELYYESTKPHDDENDDYYYEDIIFPPDVYCFDESMTWYAIFTHVDLRDQDIHYNEDYELKRMCLLWRD